MRTLPLAVFTPLLAVPAAALQLGEPAVPAANPITPAKTLLGKGLFWDEQLSATGTMACGSCHMPRYGGSDGFSTQLELATHPGLDGLFWTEDDRVGSPGVIRSGADGSYEPSPLFGLVPQVTERLAPSVINAAFFDEMLFWDGRSGGSFADPLSGVELLPEHAGLESQAAEPPVDGVEMCHDGTDWSQVAARIAASAPLALATELPADLAAFVAGRTYPQLFEEAFGTPEVTPARIAMAIATYERTLVSDQAPFDLGTLSEQELAGEVVFHTKGGCAACHGPSGADQLFSDRSYHNTGVRPIAEDFGRAALTGEHADLGKFRTPSLRNVALRPRLFHTGQFSELMEVVEFYDRGGDHHVNQDPLIHPLGLTGEEKEALVAFLGALTDPRVAQELPPFDRPELYRASSLQPYLFGLCTEGTGDVGPYPIALEPPHVQNASLTFGLRDALGGAPVVISFSLGVYWGGYTVMGAKLYLDPALIVITKPLLLEGAPGVAGAGFASLHVPLDLSPAFVGLKVYQQWLVIDPGAPQGIAASPGVGMQLF